MSRRAPIVAHALLALIVGAMAAMMFASHRAGHWWGDDWALYLRQARALLDGEPGKVLAENQFTVEMSRGPAFSPPLYPWGFPIILAPFVAVFGTDLDRLTVVPVLSAAVFACCWFALARPRLGTAAALTGVAAVTLTPVLLGWSELIQSEWPFMAVSGIALVWLDRLARTDRLTSPTARLLPLMWLGVFAAAAFSVRREGLAMVVAIAAAQLAALIADRGRSWRAAGSPRRELLTRLALPHLAAAATVVFLQITLPTTVVPKYDGTSITNVWRLMHRHVDHLAEVSGLKRPWDRQPMVLGSAVGGWVAVGAYLFAAGLGITFALTRNRVRDLHLLAYAAVAFMIGGSFRVAINRYVCTVAPLLLLLGLVALHTILRRIPRRSVAPIGVTLALAAIVAGNLANVHVRVALADEYADQGRVEWGPEHPDAIEMFAAVERLSDDDDIIAAPKARAMTLETGRLAIQVDDARPVPDDVPLALIVVERGSGIATRLIDQPDRYAVVWSNARFALLAPVDG